MSILPFLEIDGSGCTCRYGNVNLIKHISERKKFNKEEESVSQSSIRVSHHSQSQMCVEVCMFLICMELYGVSRFGRWEQLWY